MTATIVGTEMRTNDSKKPYVVRFLLSFSSQVLLMMTVLDVKNKQGLFGASDEQGEERAKILDQEEIQRV